MIKIKRLIFEGFRNPQDTASISFADGLVTVIYGDNGSGKTTFLRAINAFLSQDSVYLETIAVHSIECEFFYDDIHHTYDDDGQIIAEEVIAENCDGYIRVEKKDGQYDWSDFEVSALLKTRSLSLGVERGVATQQSRIDPDVILNYFAHPRNKAQSRAVAELRESGIHGLAEDLSRYIRTWQVNSQRSKRSDLRFESSHVNLQNIKLENVEQILMEHYRFAREVATEQIQNALFDTLSFAISDENNDELDVSRIDFIATLKNSRTRLVEALDDNSKNEFKNLIISKLKGLNEEANYDAIFDKKLLRALLWNMMGQLKLERLLLSSINLLADKFNSYLIDNKVLRILDDRVFVEVDKRELPVSDLSSGERHILTFLTLVLFQGRQRNFLIIDEPEISLNIKWQRELLELLHNLAPRTQIIVASHSPAIAKRIPNSLSKLEVMRNVQ